MSTPIFIYWVHNLINGNKKISFVCVCARVCMCECIILHVLQFFCSSFGLWFVLFGIDEKRPLSWVGMFWRRACAIVPLIHYPAKLFAFFPSGKSSSTWSSSSSPSSKSHIFKHRFARRTTRRPASKTNPNNPIVMSTQTTPTDTLIPIVLIWCDAFLCTQTTQSVNNICDVVVLHFSSSSRQYCTHACIRIEKIRATHKMADYIESLSRRNAFRALHFNIWLRIDAFFPNEIPIRNAFCAAVAAGNVRCIALIRVYLLQFQMFELCLF